MIRLVQHVVNGLYDTYGITRRQLLAVVVVVGAVINILGGLDATAIVYLVGFVIVLTTDRIPRITVPPTPLPPPTKVASAGLYVSLFGAAVHTILDPLAGVGTLMLPVSVTLLFCYDPSFVPVYCGTLASNHTNEIDQQVEDKLKALPHGWADYKATGFYGRINWNGQFFVVRIERDGDEVETFVASTAFEVVVVASTKYGWD